MAGTAVSAVRTEHELSVSEQMRLQFNKVIVDLEALRAAIDTIADKLDTDAGVTATDFAADAAVATAATMTAALVNLR